MRREGGGVVIMEIRVCYVAFNCLLMDEKILLDWLQRTDPSLD